MAKVFLDTNYFIGLANKVPEIDAEVIHSHFSFISVLSCHILFYVNKIKTPDKSVNSFISDFNLISFGKKTLSQSLFGPTNDLEDNVQLHSATKANCDFFLTKDKELLKLKVFGKLKIVDRL